MRHRPDVASEESTSQDSEEEGPATARSSTSLIHPPVGAIPRPEPAPRSLQTGSERGTEARAPHDSASHPASSQSNRVHQSTNTRAPERVAIRATMPTTGANGSEQAEVTLVFRRDPQPSPRSTERSRDTENTRASSTPRRPSALRRDHSQEHQSLRLNNGQQTNEHTTPQITPRTLSSETNVLPPINRRTTLPSSNTPEELDEPDEERSASLPNGSTTLRAAMASLDSNRPTQRSPGNRIQRRIERDPTNTEIRVRESSSIVTEPTRTEAPRTEQLYEPSPGGPQHLRAINRNRVVNSNRPLYSRVTRRDPQRPLRASHDINVGDMSRLTARTPTVNRSERLGTASSRRRSQSQDIRSGQSQSRRNHSQESNRNTQVPSKTNPTSPSVSRTRRRSEIREELMKR